MSCSKLLPAPAVRTAGFAPIAIGLGLTLIHLISIPVTNTSVNPARSLAAAVYAGDWALAQVWLFWVAPLAGAATFTWEAIFRPDGGETEQRWFHLSELDPATGLDTDNRMLFEIRVAGDKWFLDSFNQSGSASKALMNRTALHPLGAWYHVASVYDGTQFSNYVDGVREGAADLHLTPHGAGRASVGTRINKVFYFKGAVHLARFTRRALAPSEFLRVPGKP